MNGSRQGVRAKDAGFTLIEVMVATSLFSLLMVIAGSLAVLAIRTSGGIQGRLDNATQGQIGIAGVSRMLRTAVAEFSVPVCTDCDATPIVTATSTQLAFLADLEGSGTSPTRIMLRVVTDPSKPSQSMLQQVIQSPNGAKNASGTYPFCNPDISGCSARLRVLTRGLANSAAVFTYYDDAGAKINKTTLTNQDCANVTSVDVKFTVQTAPGQTRFPANTSVMRVRLPSADVNSFVS